MLTIEKATFSVPQASAVFVVKEYATSLKTRLAESWLIFMADLHPSYMEKLIDLRIRQTQESFVYLGTVELQVNVEYTQNRVTIDDEEPVRCDMAIYAVKRRVFEIIGPQHQLPFVKYIDYKGNLIDVEDSRDIIAYLQKGPRAKFMVFKIKLEKD